MTSTLLLAAEGGGGLSPDHIAADIAVPVALLLFAGSVFALLWSNYGAKKGALIYGIALFGFMGFMGVFWWFGAPGTPVATGLQNFPGQAGDVYQTEWYPFEGGSPRSEFFEADDEFSFDDPAPFEPLVEFVGTTDTEDPMYASTAGDLSGAADQMVAQYFPRNESDGLDIGAGFRTELQEATAEVDTSQLENANDEGDGPSFENYVAEVATDERDELEFYLTEDNGMRLAAARLLVFAEFTNADGTSAGRAQVAETEWFAFKDPGAIWLPSAVWTILSFLLFGLCLALLDRIEQREKRENVQVEEAMDVQQPIRQ